jgi:hypothetical protein
MMKSFINKGFLLPLFNLRLPFRERPQAFSGFCQRFIAFTNIVLSRGKKCKMYFNNLPSGKQVITQNRQQWRISDCGSNCLDDEHPIMRGY